MNGNEHDFLAAPLWLFTMLHWVTLTLHFLMMSFTLGGLIILLSGRDPGRWQRPATRRLVRLFPSTMAATVTLGVAPLLFLQIVYHRQVYSASIVSGWFWLGIFVAVIIAYYGLYAAALASDEKLPRRRWLLWLALLGMLYVSLTYSSVFSLAERPQTYAALYETNQSGTAWNPHLGQWLPRWLHMVLCAVCIAGYGVAVLGRDDERMLIAGRRAFGWGMLAAAVAGGAQLGSLGEEAAPFMRSSGSWWLTGSVFLSLLALGLFFAQRLALAGVSLALSVLGMVAVRHHVRLVRLGDQLEQLPERTQAWPLTIFLCCFALMLVVLAWMARIWCRSAQGVAAIDPIDPSS